MSNKSQSMTPCDFQFTDVGYLSRFVTETGRILPRKMTRLTAKQHRYIVRCIKRARNNLLMQ